MRTCGLRSALVFVCAALFTHPSVGRASPSGYTTNEAWSLTFPTSPESFFTAVSAFPIGTPGYVDGYPLVGRLLAATGRAISLQQTFGQSTWIDVARIDASDPAMDPSFLELAPDGRVIALGSGYGKPLYVFPTTLLAIDPPPNLTHDAAVARFQLDYYDAAFLDARYLFLNAGTSTGSAIFVLDTWGADAASRIIDAIPGASAGIAFDSSGNLVTGIGWDPYFVRTGEIRIFSAVALTSALAAGQPLDYDLDGILLASDMLSAASLGFDAKGNLFVGGGDVFGTSGNYGYANLIDQSVVRRVLAGGAPLDPDAPSELTRIAPDPCMNDDSTSVVYVAATDMLLVSANLASEPPNCEPLDWSGGSSGSGPRSQLYFSPDAPDGDGDGVPDGVDADHAPRELVSRADFVRFVAAFGATSTQSSFDAAFDFDANGVIGWADYVALRARWARPRTL